MNTSTTNVAKQQWDILSQQSQTSLMNAFETYWKNIYDSHIDEQLYEQIQRIQIQREIDIHNIEWYSGDPYKSEIAQNSLVRQTNLITQIINNSTIPQTMTYSAIQLFVDLLPLVLQQVNIAGVSDLFQFGCKFNIETTEKNIILAKEHAKINTQTLDIYKNIATNKISKRGNHRIVLYTQNPVKLNRIFKHGEYGISAACAATIYLAEEINAQHGAIKLDDGTIKLPQGSEQLKGSQIWAKGPQQKAAFQYQFFAKLIAETNMIAESYDSDDNLRWKLTAKGNNKIQSIDSNEQPYHTDKLIAYARGGHIQLVD